MINLGKHSKMVLAQVVRRATEFFGPDGLGLRVHIEGESGARFEGGGGFVVVEASATTHGSDVSVQSQEWERQAQQFLEKI